MSLQLRVIKFSRIKFLLSGLTLLAATVFAQSDSCYQNMHEGKFELTSERQDGYHVVRTKGRQIEVFNRGKSKVVCKLEWISSNQFKLTTLKLVNTPQSWDEKRGDVMFVTIVECDGVTYSVRAESEGKPALIFQYRKID